MSADRHLLASSVICSAKFYLDFSEKYSWILAFLLDFISLSFYSQELYLLICHST